MDSKRTSRGTAKRRPGRRANAVSGSRDALIDAALAEFAANGFRGTTTRSIAERAGVTAAMVHYHFKDKRGLYRAVLAASLGPLMQQLEELAARDADDSLHRALAGYMRMLAHKPDLPALLIRDVLSNEGAMREMFIEEFAAKAARAMQRILAHDLEAGALRDDVDPRLALLSLMSMAVFPFIARPVAQALLGLTYDDAMIDRLAAHTVSLFHYGVLGGTPR